MNGLKFYIILLPWRPKITSDLLNLGPQSDKKGT
nr:MAG TPA: hypothetical protein [Caudoviricetes sp.]